MAEKKERILYIVQKLDGRFVGENRITRQEAIERIIKGIENSGEANCYDEIQWVGGWKEVIAEAALNALLDE